MEKIVVGQRYVSSTEPELGLGIILEQDSKFVSVLFPVAGESRRFAISGSPLIRAQFDVGDDIKDAAGKSLIISSVTFNEGLYLYQAGTVSLLESLIHPSVLYNKPEDGLFLGKIDTPSKYRLRHQALELKSQIEKNPYRGFVGPKVSLLPHQFYVAKKVCEQPLPRVLLADEVGLGKTIEAGLILHQLIVNGRANRAIIIVPFSLINQWFIELRRHFHLQASIVNKVEDFMGGHNAFLDQTLTIVGLEFITREQVVQSALEQVDFDMVIVDEAHRLEWEEGKISPEYSVVEKIALKTPGLLLLSATPEKFGHEGHFARLKLIDPVRFHDYPQYIEEYNRFEELTQGFDKLSQEDKIKLNDEQGTGRILFRNTRQNIDQEHNIFAQRKVLPYPLKDVDKMSWLLEFIKNTDEKVLIICRSKDAIFEIDDVLSNNDDIDYLLFYSELTLVDRDKNAAQFAEATGAQVLVCSEVGSEGRNFQFCHHIVFYDLPMDPDIVEQRIGRLDRIGQKEIVQIHIPYDVETFEEVLFTWFHEGMNAFSTYMQASSYMLMSFEKYLLEAKKNPGLYLENSRQGLNELVAKTKEVYQEVKLLLNSGRNRLIAMNSFHKNEALAIIEGIKSVEKNDHLHHFLMNSFETFGVGIEETRIGQYFITPTENMSIPHFPALTADGLAFTFERAMATTMEKIDFMSVDHPMATDLTDLIISQGIGNVSVVKWTGPRSMAAIECLFVATLMTNKAYEPARFFPTEIFRVLITLDGKNVTDKMSYEQMSSDSTNLDGKDYAKVKALPRAAFKQLLAEAKKIAAPNLKQLKVERQIAIEKEMDAQIMRLEHLKKNNPNIRQEEIIFLKKKREELLGALSTMELRLDSLRLGIPK
ncbi:MAG: SNF2-related protein [Bacteriovoracaceae bacterium]